MNKDKTTGFMTFSITELKQWNAIVVFKLEGNKKGNR